MALNFAKAKNVNDKQAEKLLTAYKLAEAAGDGADDDSGDENEFEESKEKDIENKHLEDFIDKHHTNYSAISEEYKLFEVVTSSTPSQILRYSQ